ncbi:MAG: hypothetical protein HY741_27365 [Chloroflexi bacterium]|nr:hypothetical protein [Chloroflexota bacterium]
MSQSYISTELRRQVAEQARHRCGYCLTREDIVGAPMEIDHIWQDHFAWSMDSDRILGLTPVGRATVIALNLNRPSLVRARQLWARFGWHPPQD